MKKSLAILTSLIGLSLIFTSCGTLSGINKEKTDDGFIKSHDLVYNTIRYEHPSLVPNFDVGKYNLYGNKQFENIQAYIFEDKFYLEADYGNKSRKSLNIDTIMFFTKRNKIAFTNQEKNADTYYKYRDETGLEFENLKVILTPEEMNQLGRFLIADEVYISFGGERGRTDLFKLSKKIKKSMLAVINKWNRLNDQPVIEAPKPEPKAKPESEAENTEETTEEQEAENQEDITEAAAVEEEEKDDNSVLDSVKTVDEKVSTAVEKKE